METLNSHKSKSDCFDAKQVVMLDILTTAGVRKQTKANNSLLFAVLHTQVLCIIDLAYKQKVWGEPIHLEDWKTVVSAAKKKVELNDVFSPCCPL